MHAELSVAARRLQAAGKEVVAKRLAGETGYSLFLINKAFRQDMRLASLIGCKRKKLIPLKEFVRRIWRAHRIVRRRGWAMTVPALGEVSGMNDKRVRSRLAQYPKLREWLGVVPSPMAGRFAAAERRQ